MDCRSIFINILLATVTAVAVLLFAPNIPPENVKFTSYQLSTPPARVGKYAPNSILDNAERMYEGYLIGPESIASRANNEVFVSLHNGDIVRIYGKDFDKSQVVFNLGPGCAGPWEEEICGRPLGLRFAKDKKLLVADCYLGIFSVDIQTGEKDLLVDPSKSIEGAYPRIPDDLDIDNDGNIYWSDASSISKLSDAVVELLGDPTGRLIKYDPVTKKNKVLMSGIHFANGVQLSPNQDFVLVSETARSTVHRYWLKGPKAGKSEIFISNLPGMPDNIRSRKDGGYYLSLVGPQKEDDAINKVMRFMAEYPAVRKVVLRATRLIQIAAEKLNKAMPNEFLAKFIYKTLHLGVLSDMNGVAEALVVEVDENGNVIGMLQGNNGIVSMISETQQVGDYLFFASPWAPWLGRLHTRYLGQTSKHDEPPPKVEKKEEKTIEKEPKTKKGKEGKKEEIKTTEKKAEAKPKKEKKETKTAKEEVKTKKQEL